MNDSTSPIKRLKGEASTVHVRGERPADAQPVGAGLFLDNAPLRPPTALLTKQIVDQPRPLDPGFDLDLAPARIEPEHPHHVRHVQEDGAAPELLAAHRVPSSGDADRLPLTPGVLDDSPEALQGIRFDHAIDTGQVQLRVDIVDQGRARLRERQETSRRPPRESGAAYEELPSSQHGHLTPWPTTNHRAPRNIMNSATAWITW
jgi:hypothetical protein